MTRLTEHSNCSNNIGFRISAILSLTEQNISTRQKCTVIYAIKCPGCGEDYVRKTDRCVMTRLNEHNNRSNNTGFWISGILSLTEQNILTHQKSTVIYSIKCPGSGEDMSVKLIDVV